MLSITKDNDAPTGLTLGFGTVDFNYVTATVSGALDAGAGLHATPYYFDRNVPTSANSGYQTGSSWIDSSLDSNTMYSYRVKSKDALGNESAFTALQNKFTLAKVPGTPTVNNAAVNSLDVALNANANPAATQFAIYDINTAQFVQSNGSEGASAAWQTNTQWGTKTVTGLTANTQHCFQAKARNGDLVETALGSQACGTTLGVFAPTGLTLIFKARIPDLNSGRGDVNLVWTDASPAEEGYRVYRSLDGTSFQLASSLAANTVNYIDNNSGSGLRDFTTYYYKVSAFVGGTDANSSVANILLPDRTAPSVPDENAVVVSRSHELTFSWFDSTDNNSSIDLNYITRCSSGNGCTALNAVGFGTRTTIIDNNAFYAGLQDGNNYCFTASAKDSSGNESVQSAPEKCYTFTQNCAQLNGFICLGLDMNQSCNGSDINGVSSSRVIVCNQNHCPNAAGSSSI